jgi:hypothetical protein
MAIKVSGTTVIDDSRNTNTGILTATSVLVGTGVTINAGIVSATSFRGDGSLLTGVSAGGGASSDITGNLFF